jgi:hypothetical protein
MAHTKPREPPREPYRYQARSSLAAAIARETGVTYEQAYTLIEMLSHDRSSTVEDAPLEARGQATRSLIIQL